MNIFDEFDKADADVLKFEAEERNGERGASIQASYARGWLHKLHESHGPKLLALARAARRNRRSGLRIECRNGCGTVDRPRSDGSLKVCPLCELNAALDALEAPR